MDIMGSYLQYAIEKEMKSVKG